LSLACLSPIEVTLGRREYAEFYAGRDDLRDDRHVVEVEVDIKTCDIRILRYIVVSDSGRMINPMMVEGQIAGSVAHGIGNALYEWMGYDERAQPVTTNFADYLLNRVEPIAMRAGPNLIPPRRLTAAS
jgi:carbon-monoxide dehydrogenase large subunit